MHGKTKSCKWCSAFFDSSKELEAHHCEPASSTNLPAHTISSNQMSELETPPPRGHCREEEENKWFRMFTTLFPHKKKPKTPCRFSLHSHIPMLSSFIATESKVMDIMNNGLVEKATPVIKILTIERADLVEYVASRRSRLKKFMKEHIPKNVVNELRTAGLLRDDIGGDDESIKDKICGVVVSAFNQYAGQSHSHDEPTSTPCLGDELHQQALEPPRKRKSRTFTTDSERVPPWHRSPSINQHRYWTQSAPRQDLMPILESPVTGSNPSITTPSISAASHGYTNLGVPGSVGSQLNELHTMAQPHNMTIGSVGTSFVSGQQQAGLPTSRRGEAMHMHMHMEPFVWNWNPPPPMPNEVIGQERQHHQHHIAPLPLTQDVLGDDKDHKVQIMEYLPFF